MAAAAVTALTPLLNARKCLVNVTWDYSSVGFMLFGKEGTCTGRSALVLIAFSRYRSVPVVD